MCRYLTSGEITKELIKLGEKPTDSQGFTYGEVVRILRKKYKKILGAKSGQINIAMDIHEANNNKVAVYDDNVDIYKEIRFSGFESQTEAVACLILSLEKEDS